MSFKDISYLELWLTFCSAEPNHLCNFGRKDHEEQFCEINFNLVQWFRCYKISYLELWWPLSFSRGEPFVQFGRGHHEEQNC